MLFKKIIFISLLNTFLVIQTNFQYLTNKQLIQHIEKSIQNAEKGFSKIDNSIFEIQGMSSLKVRHFLNNLLSISSIKYLEIGTWKGSTFIAGLYNNQNNIIEAIAIDDWSQNFGISGVKEEFGSNLKRLLKGSYNYKFYESDCFNIDLKTIFKNKINIYFYDGEHSEKSQKLAFTYYNSILDDTFIAIVDDYNEASVQKGTQDAFKELNYKVIYEKHLPSRFNGDLENWWNGLYVALISKK